MALSWEQAQRNERAFWESIYVQKKRDIATYTPITEAMALDFARETLRRFGHTFESLDGLVIADVGCGPYGLVAGIDLYAADHGVRPKKVFGIDPLMDTYRTFGTLPERPYIEWITSKGESMPLPEGACDIVYSTNVVDHVDDPEGFLRDCRRICRTGGEFLFAVHTVTPRFAFLRPVLFLVDKNHPHHFIGKALRRMTENWFAKVEVASIVSMIEDQPDFTLRNVFRAKDKLRAMKRWISTFLLETAYYRCWK